MTILRAQIFLCLGLLLVARVFSGKEDGSFQIWNVYGKKCLSFASNNRLQLARCTYGLDVFFKWTADGKLKGAYSGNQNKCIQIHANISIKTGDCSSPYSVSWSCHGRTLRVTSSNWFLAWNIHTNETELVKTMNGREALWVLLDTDNEVCDWPVRQSTTTTPFTQPTKQLRQRQSDQLWPQGVYALPKAASGCPGSSNFTWQEGWIFQDLDDMNDIKTRSSSSFNMAAVIDEWGNVKRWFCTKKNHTQNEENIRPLWPRGTYCIYSARSFLENGRICPRVEGTSRFRFGIGFWDNQFWMNDSKMKGTLPRGHSVTGGRTNIYFCCQENQHANHPISLPIDQPFYLLAFKSSVCQKVKWATVIPQFILYDTSDYNNKDTFILHLPFNATRHDPKIYYCYYEGCNHTLSYDNETEDEINFPESNFLDLTSQSCSWRITFPLHYIIVLDVISLDIPSFGSNDCDIQFLKISDIEQEGNVSSVKLCGNSHKYKLRSQANSVMIVLKLEQNVTNSTGFHLSFKGILSTDISSSTSSSEMATSARSTKTTTQTSPYPTEINSDNPHTTSSASTENIKTATAGHSKNEQSQVSTTSIVVPVVVVLLIGSVVVIAWLVKKKRKKTVNTVVRFQKDNFAQENPIYEKDQAVVNEDENGNVTLYESVDNDSVHQENLSKVPVSCKEDISCNPLYQSADEVYSSDYSSTVNSLYVSSGH